MSALLPPIVTTATADRDRAKLVEALA